MRKGVLAAAAFLALAGCQKKSAETPKPPAAPGAPPAAGAGAPATSAALPQRAPGLWEQRVTTAGRSQVSRLCLDKAVEQRFTAWGQTTGRGACSRARVTPRAGGGWAFASSCDMGRNGRTDTRGVVTGDFSKSYKVQAKSTVSGAAAPLMNGTHEMNLEAVWQGPCPAGMQPGDLELPGGVKINMLRMSQPGPPQ
jgi:hypothetical protein